MAHFRIKAPSHGGVAKTNSITLRCVNIAVLSLQNVPNHKGNWLPGREGMILGLVDASLSALGLCTFAN